MPQGSMKRRLIFEIISFCENHRTWRWKDNEKL